LFLFDGDDTSCRGLCLEQESTFIDCAAQGVREEDMSCLLAIKCIHIKGFPIEDQVLATICILVFPVEGKQWLRNLLNSDLIPLCAEATLPDVYMTKFFKFLG
jgi:hypothetical protein